jgi:hypothetical protein
MTNKKEKTMHTNLRNWMGHACLIAIVSVLCLIFLGPGVAWAEKPATVLVVNPSTSPVPVRNVDAPVIQRFQMRSNLHLSANTGANTLSESLPAGKMLVIEHFSVIVRLPHGQKAMRVGIMTQLANQLPDMGFLEHFFPTQFQGTALDDRDTFIASQQVRLYSVGQLAYALERDAFTEEAAAEFVISGYLIDAD